MNAFTRTSVNVLPRILARRTMATESRSHLHTGMPKNFAELKNNIWFSDPGAYPVMFTLVFACGFATAFIAYNVVKNPDVRITPTRRQTLIRDWE